jgi:hypothetical protein
VSLVGGSLRDVQVLTGHASLTTTSRYIATDIEVQQKLVKISIGQADLTKIGIASRGQPPYLVRYRQSDSKSAMRQFDAIFKRVPVFEQGAVCLTKFGPESGETADEILARKELERRSALAFIKTNFGGASAKRAPRNR